MGEVPPYFHKFLFAVANVIDQFVLAQFVRFVKMIRKGNRCLPEPFHEKLRDVERFVMAIDQNKD